MSQDPKGRRSVAAEGAASSASGASSTTEVQSRRVGNACQGCKRRKAKCSGQPAPCERCRKLNIFCHFDEKLDTRRKESRTAVETQQRQQYILHAVLHALRCNDEKDLKELLRLLRQNESPRELAQCLLEQIHSLQERQIITQSDIDIDDVLSLAVDGIFQEPIGRRPPRPGAWSALSSFAIDQSSELNPRSQEDGSMYDTYLGSVPNYDPGAQAGAATAAGFQAYETDIVKQFGLDPQLVNLAERPTMLNANRFTAALHLNGPSTFSLLDDRAVEGNAELDTLAVESGQYDDSQQLLDGFSEQWPSDLAKWASH